MDNEDQEKQPESSGQKIGTGDFVKVGLLVVLAFVALLMIALGVGLTGELTGNNSGVEDGTNTGGACANIPGPYKTIFEKAGAKWNVQPAFIAAIFYAGEHGSSWPSANGPWASSPKGAQGPFQFMPGTWESNKQDGDGDGQMDVQNLTDSAFAAAHLFANIGAGGNTTDLNSLKDAASKYNSGRPWSVGQTFKETRPYVEKVITAFQSFQCVPSNVANIPGLANFSKYYLSQRDYTAAIDKNGCKATTLAMMVNYVLGQPNLLTVPEAWALGSRFENAEKSGPAAGKITSINLGAQSSTTKIQCYLNHSIPVGIGVGNGAYDNSLPSSQRFTSRTHWAVITGIEDDKFLLADPYFKTRTKFSLQAILSNSFGAYAVVPKGQEGMCK